MTSISIFDKTLAERASSAIEAMLSTDFRVAIKTGKFDPCKIALELDQDFFYVGILSKIHGPINVYALIIIDMSSADEIMQILTNEHIFYFDDLKQSALQELGNVVIGSFASELGNKMGARIDYTIPLVAVDQPNALFDSISAIISERDSEQLELDFLSYSPPIIAKLVLFNMGGKD